MSEQYIVPRIALVIPMLNEASTLPKLLSAIQIQSRRPDEIVFVDAGSSDDSRSVIVSWWEKYGWADGVCRVEVTPGGFPGYNRNIGIKTTSSELIAFIDCGIYPEPDWLEQLLACLQRSSAQAVYGVCDFSAEGAIAKAACALSYGMGSEHPVLPASLFHRSVFASVGMFEENLRAAEDVKWMAQVKLLLGPMLICKQARVHYRVFPDSLTSVARKWYRYKYYGIVANINKRQNVLWLIIAIIAALSTIFLSWKFAAWVGIGYLMLRGMLDPIRRSNSSVWLKRSNIPAIAIAPLIALTIDAAKLIAIVFYYPRKIFNQGV